MYIVVEGVNVYGVFLFVLFSILIGFNEQMVWGIINVGQDVFDWYCIDWIDESCIVYKLDGKVIFVEMFVDSIWVCGVDKFIIVEMFWMVFGFVVYD